MSNERSGAAKKLDQFETGQLSELEKAVAADRGTDVLAKAKSIGLISDATEEKVNRALGEGHNVIFTDVFNKAREAAQREEADPDKARSLAFKRAFESVYGKFLFEQGGDELEDYSGPAMKKLKPVLKFAVDEKDGLKGRSELKVAMRRLRDAVKLRGPKYQTQINTHTADKQAKFDAARRNTAESEDKVDPYDVAFGYFHGIQHLAGNFAEKLAMPGFDRLFKEVPEIKGLVPVPEDAEYKNKVGEVYNRIESISTDSDVDPELAGLCSNFVDEHDRLGSDAEKENFSKRHLLYFLQELEEKTREKKAEHTKPDDENRRVMALISKNFEALKKDEVASDEVKDLCGVISTDLVYAATSDEFSVILTAKLPELEAAVKETMEPAAKTAKAELAKAKIEEQKAEKELKYAEELTPETWLMDKAFPTAKSGAELKGLERVHGEALTEQKKMKETYEYFAHHHNLEVFLEAHNSYHRIVDGASGKLGDGSGFYTARAEANRQFKITEKALHDLWEPNIERDLEAVAKRYRAANKISEYDETKERSRIEENHKKKKDRYSTDIVTYEADKDAYENVFEQATKLHPEVKKLVQNMEAAYKLGIHFEDGFDPRNLVLEFKTFEPKSRSFNPIQFLAFSEKLRAYFGDHHKVEHLQQAFDAKLADNEKATKDAKKALDKATAEAEKGKNLTDASAAKRIMGVLVAEAFPDMTMVEQAKFCTLQLARDVGKIQSQEGYMALARQGGAELLDTVNTVGIRGKLISFKYKEKDSEIQPFKGLKPEDFKDWPNIEKLFDVGRLNHKNGLFALAALELLDREKHGNSDVSSVQTVRMKEKVRALFARDELKVSDELLEHSSVSAVVDEAFAKQMEKIRPLVAKHFGNYAKEGENSKAYMVVALNDEYKDLKDNLRDGVITPEVFEVKLKGLVKEAVEADIVGSVDFKQDEVAAKYWNSKEAQWLRDRATDIGKSILRTGRDTLVYAPLKIGAYGMWGMTKAGASLGFNALLLPVRAAKYPLLMAGKIASAPINLFRKQPLTLPKLKETFTKDMYRVLNYSKEGINSNAKGAFSRVGTELKAGWGASKHKREEYKGRTEKKRALRAAKIKSLREKAPVPVVEVAGSPFLDYSIYTDKIAEAAKLLGVVYGGSRHGGQDVSVGPSSPASKPGGKDEAGGGHGAAGAGGHGKKDPGKH